MNRKENDNVLEITRKIREIMDTSSFPERNQHDLNQGIAEMERLKERPKMWLWAGYRE